MFIRRRSSHGSHLGRGFITDIAVLVAEMSIEETWQTGGVGRPTADGPQELRVYRLSMPQAASHEQFLCSFCIASIRPTTFSCYAG
jgi:hypothetical protein